MADAFTNFAKSTLAGGLAPATTALTVQVGDGALFPAAGAGQTFRCVLQNTANQREVILVSTRVGDAFTVITRAQEGTLALTWNAGDRIGHRLTAAQLNNILFSSDLQQNTKTWCGTAGGTANALTLTPAPAVTAMVAGHKFIFKTGAIANTTPVTISVSGLGTFAAQNAGAALVAGALTASTWWEVLYDGAAGQLKKYSLAVEASVFTAKGSLVAASAAGTPVERTVGTDGQIPAADSSQTSGLVYIDNPSRPNLLINPNFQIDQIQEGGVYTASGVTGGNMLDGWSAIATGAGTFTAQQVADPENAALKAMKISCTVADAAIAAGDRYTFYTAVEGYDAASLMLGTASAQSIIAQFKFKTTITGVYGIWLANSAINRAYVGTITVADTSEHEYTVTLTLDTTGTWLYTNGVGLYFGICLAAGSTYQTTSGSWQAGGPFYTTSAQCNFMSVNTNIAYLKRVQLMQGSLVQAYKPADIQKELARAQRYYCKTFSQGVAPAQNAGIIGVLTGFCLNATAGPRATWEYPVEMRTAPTIITYNPGAANANWRSVAAAGDDTAGVGTAGTRGVEIVSTTANQPSHYENIHATANARLS